MKLTFTYYPLFLIYGMISLVLIILSNYFIFKSGKDQRENLRNTNLLLVILIINATNAFVNIFLLGVGFSYSTPLTDLESEILLSYYISTSLFITIPSLISYGFLFSVYGYLNRKESDIYLLIAGISWTIYYGFKVITV